MLKEIFDPQITRVLKDAQDAYRRGDIKTVRVNGTDGTNGVDVPVPYPFPSPGDWRDNWIYFLMLDRFCSSAAPAGTWNQKFGYRQGGTFQGVQSQLGYLQALGVKALWLSPVLKNSQPENWEYNYHGYGIQDFLNIDERFASDGTLATAEAELTALIEEAHARGMYVIFDIVINHTARVFDYVRGGQTTSDFTDESLIHASLGQEPDIQWLNGLGFPRSDWQNSLPNSSQLFEDDAIWPSDLQRTDFFRRRGNKPNDNLGPQGFVVGDFGSMRQLVIEYDARPANLGNLLAEYGKTPVLSILIRAYQYLIAKYNVDGYRIDTVKYVDPDMVETFGNAMREYAMSIGKTNFFTFGEIYDNEKTIGEFVGRNNAQGEGFGIDAALDFPLFFILPEVVKANQGVEKLRNVFVERKNAEKDRISSHGEAGKYFVSFLDNHDQKQRFRHPFTPQSQVLQGLALLFTLQGIPCLYYGTEQGLDGTKTTNGQPALDSFESVREALWGKNSAFDQTDRFFAEVQRLSILRREQSALRYGRLYFREVSGNGIDFGHSAGNGGVIAFSRILVDSEILIVANTSTTNAYNGKVVVDFDINRKPQTLKIAYSNLGSSGSRQVQIINNAQFYEGNQPSSQGTVAALSVNLLPSEIQIFV